MAASKILAACLMLASQTYSIPPAVMVGIYKAEGGKVGQEVKNTNGSYDLGPMQINTIWLPELAEKWGVSEDTARKWVRDDACTNVSVSAWILGQHIKETKSLSQAIAYYNSRTPRHGNKYQKRVIDIMRDSGLVRSQR
ncbi:MAG: transglycosylase [Micavibrio sp.]|nr:transglycosylase [Micavibrio sp.]|tara:strand:- start:1054 stop:1470 length:417 start_codon:yes stop_codon:yes gene_type:complete